MGRTDVFLPCQIRDGPTHLQNPRVSSGTQAQFVDCHLQKLLARTVDGTELFHVHVSIGHLGVTVDLGSFKPLRLDFPRPVVSLPQYPRRFTEIMIR